ncbi:MAG: thiamine phosphate synthase [Phycisphaeraceae bacterium]|nr:thiamine phosphate synthase [Phycisphaeraceae bacterium]
MNPLYRILDANGNRAREGLRVLEDIARFALNDGAASEELKRLRHALVEAIGTLTGQSNDPLLLLEARDTPGDVGTSISTPSETARTDLIHLVRSNASRLGEALRSMEEAAKALSGESGPFEQARYSVYTVERRLVLALAKPVIPRVRLCVLITGSMCVLPWQSVAETIARRGCNMIQVREKEMSDRELLARVRCVMEIRDRLDPSALVIVNDRPHIAWLAEADGVHVGQGDLALRMLVRSSASEHSSAYRRARSKRRGPQWPWAPISAESDRCLRHRQRTSRSRTVPSTSRRTLRMPRRPVYHTWRLGDHAGESAPTGRAWLQGYRGILGGVPRQRPGGGVSPALERVERRRVRSTPL